MTKSVLAIAIITLTTLFASGAEAGFKVRLGFGGPVPFHNHYASKPYQPKIYRKKAHREVYRRPVRSQEATKVAKTPSLPKPKPVETAAFEMENSTIATAKPGEAHADATTDTKAQVQTAAVETPKELGCKKFFPAVGMTLSVPCE